MESPLPLRWDYYTGYSSDVLCPSIVKQVHKCYTTLVALEIAFTSLLWELKTL